MNHLFPSQFFDLTLVDFAHIFPKERPVWHVLEQLKEFLLSHPLGKIEGVIAQGVTLINPEEISIGVGTVVEAGAYIVGPCLIGKNCQIRNGAYIRGTVLTGDHCIIGHGTEVKNSILLYKAQAGHFAYIGDSILGSHTNLGAGTKCANLRLDHEPISLFDGQKKIHTGLRKLGLILGDGGQTGCNSVTNPGTLMGKKSASFPCVNVSGLIPEGMVVKPHQPHLLS